MSSSILGFRGKELQIFAFGHAPDGESNDVNHAEAELFLQAVDDVKVRLCEANGSGFKILVLHAVLIVAVGRPACHCPRAGTAERNRGDISKVLRCEDFWRDVYNSRESDVQDSLVVKSSLPPSANSTR